MSRKGQPNGNFFPVSHLVVETEKFKGMKPTSKNLYFTLCQLRNRFGKNKDGFFFRKDRDLQLDSRLSSKPVLRARKELIQCGFIKWEKGRPYHPSWYKIMD